MRTHIEKLKKTKKTKNKYRINYQEQEQHNSQHVQGTPNPKFAFRPWTPPDPPGPPRTPPRGGGTPPPPGISRLWVKKGQKGGGGSKCLYINAFASIFRASTDPPLSVFYADILCVRLVGQLVSWGNGIEILKSATSPPFFRNPLLTSMLPGSAFPP